MYEWEINGRKLLFFILFHRTFALAFSTSSTSLICEIVICIVYKRCNTVDHRRWKKYTNMWYDTKFIHVMYVVYRSYINRGWNGTSRLKVRMNSISITLDSPFLISFRHSPFYNARIVLVFCLSESWCH